MQDVLASIVVPVGADSDTLAQCLEAIKAQDFPKKEVVIVCDAVGAALPSLPRGSRDVRVIKEREAVGMGHLVNAGMRAARGDVKILLMPYCIPVGSDWLSGMVAPFDDPAVAVVVGRCSGQDNPTRGLAARLLDAVDPPQRRTREKGARRQDLVSHLCDAYRATVLADVGYFEQDQLVTPGEAIDISLKINQAGHKVLLSGAAEVEYNAPRSKRSLPGVMAKALDYGLCDAVLDRRHSLRWLNSGIFAAALLSLLLLPLGAVDMRAGLVLSAIVFVWGWFLGLRLPGTAWELPPSLIGFAGYATVLILIRDDWWPGLFGKELHPSIIRRWCWLGTVTATHLLLLGRAGLLAAVQASRGRGGLLYAPAVFALALAWWLLVGAGYLRGQFLSRGGKE